MLETVKDLSPVLQTLLATGFTWGMTALRAGLVATHVVSQREDEVTFMPPTAPQ